MSETLLDAKVAFGRKVKKIGYFASKEAAKRAYDIAAASHQGEFARQ